MKLMMNIWKILPFLTQISSLLSIEHINVECQTTKGDITITVYPEWAPLGAKRFIDLVNDEFFTGLL